MIAMCLIREQPHYRRDAFVHGLRQAGYTLVDHGRPSAPADLLVIWNRYGHFESMADRWEQQGGSVLVAENGYIGKDTNGHQLYALAMHGHNGSGWWPTGDASRWNKLGVPVQEWVSRADGYALVCGQRGIGSRQMASPTNWHYNVGGKWTFCPIKLRLHPGNKPDPTAPRLEDDLKGARYCVIWSSGSGVKSLIAGVPVIYDAPHWICEDAAVPLRGFRAGTFEMPSPDALSELRQTALERMAWAQWTIAELESGLPFTLFRDAAQTGEVSW